LAIYEADKAEIAALGESGSTETFKIMSRKESERLDMDMETAGKKEVKKFAIREKRKIKGCRQKKNLALEMEKAETTCYEQRK
ncbi:hypothetical protein BgiBS90_026252, partial [Biomphalaria glabrata]